MDAVELTDFFQALKEYGTEYSRLQDEGDTDGAAQVIGEAEQQIIAPFFGDGIRGDGDIKLTSSTINTSAELSHMFLISNGNVDVGLTTIPDPAELTSGAAQESESGIFTSKGGVINIFSAGDLNVNESRVMTFRGGDILVWSDGGDINAGRGSKTAINAGSPKVVSVRDDHGNVIARRIEWEPPSVGSGIRTLTYDPDGSQGPQVAPIPGDAFLFAPQGVIDAGEAGIAARNVVLGATEVVNVQNISFSQGSVGVPAASEGAASLGALTGVGGLAEASRLTEQTAALASERSVAEQQAARLAEQFMARWLEVKVIGFEE
jgi:hypothetical protein